MNSNIVQNSKVPSQSPNFDMSSMELALLGGDLGKLSEKDRAAYYSKVCESVGLNPLTWPFEYIKLDGKLKLYAKKDCTDQLRSIRGVSIAKAETRIQDGLAIVEVTATTKDGRSDCDMGCVPIQGLSGNALGNALMKAVTKAKRRVTLSICGLGWLDESEVESIESVQPLPEKVLRATPEPKRLEATQTIDLAERLRELNWTPAQFKQCLESNFPGKTELRDLFDRELRDLRDFLNTFETTTLEFQRVGWTPRQCQDFLLANFGKETRSSLTFAEIAELLKLLQFQ